MNNEHSGLLVSLLLGASAAYAADTSSASYSCLIEPSKVVELRSPVEGKIEKVSVDRGDEVKQGQLLVELESGVERAALEAAAYRATMQGESRLAETRLNNSSAKLVRREELLKNNFVSHQDRDDTFSEVQLADAEVLQAKDNKQLSAIEHRRLKEVLKLRELRSPFDGLVTQRMQHPGALAFTGEGASPILKIVQTNPLRDDHPRK
jgi:multidrug efflux pump subunit AcrA (membrane-fusion protein)